MMRSLGLQENWEEMQEEDNKKKAKTLKKLTQRKVHDLLHLRQAPDAEERTRKKQKSLNLRDEDALSFKDFTVRAWTPGAMARTTNANLKRLKALTNPKIAAAAWGYGWNRWTTKYRHGKQDKCCMCNLGDTKDHMDHYPYCEWNRGWMEKRLNENSIMLGDRHMWTLTHPKLKDDDELLQKLGIWIYVAYRCSNHQRNATNPIRTKKEVWRAMDQWGFEAIRNTPKLKKTWKGCWSRPEPEKDTRKNSSTKKTNRTKNCRPRQATEKADRHRNNAQNGTKVRDGDTANRMKTDAAQNRKKLGVPNRKDEPDRKRRKQTEFQSPENDKEKVLLVQNNSKGMAPAQ